MEKFQIKKNEMMKKTKLPHVNLKFKAVQLDLARQMETSDFIFKFIDFIEKAGYNTLVLYLEGRIKTKSFPYPAKGECYTPEEMKKVVTYAAKKKIDVVPVISALGHAELFLRHKELEHLAELRGNARSRFGGNFKHVFCPSLPDTVEFIKRYLSEIAAIFPSEYLHLGCDEAWDMACCPLCRDRVHNGETQGGIFAKYLMDLHGFVTKKLRRRMIIWDDLFEYYTDALETIPRDIILCCWNYDRHVEVPKAHFKSRFEEDIFAKYERMGFKYIFAPATYHAENVKSFTSYSAKYKPLGGLLTTWGKSLNFMHEVLPLIHYAGRLWNKKNISFDDAMKELFGVEDDLFLGALRTYYERKICHPSRLDPNSYLTGPLSSMEALMKSTCEIISDVLNIYYDKTANEISKNIIEDILVSLEWKRIMFALRSAMGELYSFGKETPDAARRKQLTAGLAEMVAEFLKRKLDQWKRFRKGISSAKIEKTFSGFKEKILNLVENSSKSEGLLSVKFFLPDMYNFQKTSFTMEFEDGTTEKVAEGAFKDYEMNDSYYTFKFPYYTKKKPAAVIIESYLYGGQGITYLEIISKKGRFVPSALKNLKGNLQSPQHILINDLRWCYIGENDMEALFRNPELSYRRHGLTVTLELDDF